MKAETEQKIGRWILDRIGEMAGEEELIAEEEGSDFLPALQAIGDALHASKGDVLTIKVSRKRTRRAG